MSKLWLLILTIALPALIASCSSHYVPRNRTYELWPVGSKHFVTEGREVMYDIRSGVEVCVTFLDNPYDMMMFDVQVTNNSDWPVAVKRGDIFLCPMKDIDDKSIPANSVRVKKATDHRELISKIDGKIGSENFKHGLASFFRVTFLVVLGIVYIASAVAQVDDADETGETYNNMAEDQRSSSSDHENILDDLYYDKSFIGDNALMDTIVKPGEHVYGSVLLRVKEPPRFFRIVVPINGTFFEFPYMAFSYL